MSSRTTQVAIGLNSKHNSSLSPLVTVQEVG